MSDGFRLVAECDDVPDYPLVLDVRIDAEGNLATVPFFGVVGKISGAFYPVVMLKSGEIDYGQEYKNPERECPCNLRKKTIGLGIQFTLEEWDSDTGRYTKYLYVVKQLLPFEGK